MEPAPVMDQTLRLGLAGGFPRTTFNVEGRLSWGSKRERVRRSLRLGQMGQAEPARGCA
ncbi:hypothetical protein I2H38_02115 [Microvirga sp. BT350]|uniref:Uncharacterized protein n=2 Tax=Microvirga alba TaxID=2791025 RepID=A0A931BJN7_9HYPH|nr:hypothetical protein [Microvirga alba]